MCRTQEDLVWTTAPYSADLEHQPVAYGGLAAQSSLRRDFRDLLLRPEKARKHAQEYPNAVYTNMYGQNHSCVSSIHIYIYMYIHIHIHIHAQNTSISISISISICISICICICICICTCICTCIHVCIRIGWCVVHGISLDGMWCMVARCML